VDNGVRVLNVDGTCNDDGRERRPTLKLARMRGDLPLLFPEGSVALNGLNTARRTPRSIRSCELNYVFIPQVHYKV
jgi:hypothetical protein